MSESCKLGDKLVPRIIQGEDERGPYFQFVLCDGSKEIGKGDKHCYEEGYAGEEYFGVQNPCKREKRIALQEAQDDKYKYLEEEEEREISRRMREAAIKRRKNKERLEKEKRGREVLLGTRHY